MHNRDVLRHLRDALDLSDAQVAEIMAHAGPPPSPQDTAALLGTVGEEDAEEDTCSDDALRQFLDGLIVARRGPPPPGAAPRVATGELTHNDVLKKLRIALTLLEPDMHAIFASAQQPVSKGELSDLFRKPSHKSHRPASDEVLSGFLRGLTQRLRG